MTRGTQRTLSRLPGPDMLLLLLWSRVTFRCDDLMFRYCRAYRRYRTLKRLRA